MFNFSKESKDKFYERLHKGAVIAGYGAILYLIVSFNFNR